MSPTLNVECKRGGRKANNIVINNNANNNMLNNLFFNQNLMLDPLPELQPILDFDGNDDEVDGNMHSTATQTPISGNGRRSRKKKEFRAADVLLRKQAPTFLLIESLIWNFCRTNESDKRRQKELFNRLCQQLHRLQLIGSSFRSESLHPIREFILLKFEELIVRIRSEDGHCLVSSPSVGPSIDSPHLIHQSRYREDFEDLGLIEAGGFGVVHRAKYRFDDHEYAVKMIRFKYTDKYDQVFKKIIREVQLYANLSSHPNVVAYKTAWLENWCLHQETLPLSKHLKISKELGASLTNGDTYALDDSLNTNFPQRNSETDVSIRFEESSKSGLRIESSNRSNSRKTSSEYKHKQMTIDYREVRDESDQEESSSSDEESSDSDQSVETFRLQSFDDLTSIRSPIKRKKTISMSSTQSQSDSAIEYRQCVQVQKFAKPDAIPEITIESCHPNGCPFSCSDFGAILYIQMELCGKNLKTWLRERNDRIFIRLNELVSEGKIDKKTSPVFLLSDCEKKEAKNIFRQVLKGVEYIHSQHLIHRDLKPQNILFSIDGSKVKIGDFGLATLHNSNQVIHPNIAQNRQFWQTSTDPTSIPTSATYENGNDLTHTGNIGTSIYASPEQKNRKDYDHKTDIFSLGLILFELFYPLSTEMEKVKCVSNITKKQCLPPSLRESSENVAKIITAMTHPNSALRPNASEVLHSSLFLSEEQMIIRQMEDQNKQIIKELSLKDNKIRELENSLQIERQKRIEMELAIEKMRKDMEAMGKQLKTSLANGF